MRAVIFLAIWTALAVAGYFQGKPKGRPVLGAMLGFWLGLIGLAIMAFIPARKTPAGPAA
jgi:hypothetical protein